MSLKPLLIRDLSSLVKLCSADDVIIDGTMSLRREVKLNTWARIEQKRGSSFNPSGHAIEQSRDTRTHLITIRFREDIDVSATAWVYETKRNSSDRWFKVLGIDEVTDRNMNSWIMLRCRQVERSDNSTAPIDLERLPDENKTIPQFGSPIDLPQGVKL